MALRISFKLHHNTSEQAIFSKWLSDLNTGLPPGKQMDADRAAKQALFWAINESYRKVEANEKGPEVQPSNDATAGRAPEVPSDQRTEET